MICGILKVDLVCSDTKTADNYQIFRFLEYTRSELRLGPDTDNMHISADRGLGKCEEGIEW